MSRVPRADELYDVAEQALPYKGNEEFLNERMGGERLVVVEVGEPAVLERGVTHPQSTLRPPGQLLEALREIATVVTRAPLGGCRPERWHRADSGPVRPLRGNSRKSLKKVPTGAAIAYGGSRSGAIWS